MLSISVSQNVDRMFFSLHISDHSADRRLWFLTCFLGGCHGIEGICAVRDWSSVAVDSNKSWCVFTTDAVFSNQIGTASSVYPVLDLARTKSSHTCLICKGLGRSIYCICCRNTDTGVCYPYVLVKCTILITLFG